MKNTTKKTHRHTTGGLAQAGALARLKVSRKHHCLLSSKPQWNPPPAPSRWDVRRQLRTECPCYRENWIMKQKTINNIEVQAETKPGKTVFLFIDTVLVLYLVYKFLSFWIYPQADQIEMIYDFVMTITFDLFWLPAPRLSFSSFWLSGINVVINAL